MRRPFASSIVVLALAACGAESPAPPVAPTTSTTTGAGITASVAAPTPPPTREDGRLPVTATPQRYSLALAIDPTQPRFSGNVKILATIPAPTMFIVLHARDVRVGSAVAIVGGRAIKATPSMRVAHGGLVPEELVLTFAETLPAGPARIEIAFDAPFGDALAGLYRTKEADRWYAFTQFEATDARRAFPCFDEPGFKTAYDVSITAPKGMIAIANAPETFHKDQGNMTTFGFATTRPMPSYLVAFAVGDFDVRAGASTPVPIRLVSTKGRSGLGQLGLDATAGLVAKLGEYFDVRYPYEKLDIVAVPDFAAGAMENPGLITFRDELLLLDPATATTGAKRAQAEVIAHELAHQWFGNLVTMQWWDDLWLNEGFATWMEAKVVDQWRPSFGARLERVQGTQGVMDTDALHSARAVREPVRSTGEAMEAFDGITYQKGAAVLAMIEQWIGEATFQKGVRDYVRANAWKNAKAEDLLRALDLASNKDVTKVAGAFLDHPGVPNVAVATACDKKGVTITLKQSPWHPLGGATDATPATWSVPMCMLVEGTKGPVCTTSGAEPATKELLGAKCPAWVHANAGQTGYFRFVLDATQTRALAKSAAQLDVANRIGLVSNLWAQVRSGELAPDAYLDTLASFDRETERVVIEPLVWSLYGIEQGLVDDAALPGFRAYVAARLGARKQMLGWEAPKHGKESDDRSLLRRTVIMAMGDLASDDATLKEADTIARAWLKDPASVNGDTAQIAVPLASRRAGKDRLEALRAAATSAKTPQDRTRALNAMSGFDDPEVLKAALALVLTDEVRVSEIRHVLWPAFGRRASRQVVYAWVRANFDALRAKLAGPLARGLMYSPGALCSQKERDDAQTFFAARSKDIEGSKRILDEALETAQLCAALRDGRGAAVTAYFTKKR